MSEDLIKEMRDDIKTVVRELSTTNATLIAHSDRLAKLETADERHEKDIHECHAKHREHEGAVKALKVVGSILGVIMIIFEIVSLVKAG